MLQKTSHKLFYTEYIILKKKYLNINPNLFMLQAFIQVRKSLNHMVIYVQQNAPTNTPSSFQTVKLKLIFTLSVSLSNCERPLTLPNTFSNNFFLHLLTFHVHKISAVSALSCSALTDLSCSI